MNPQIFNSLKSKADSFRHESVGIRIKRLQKILYWVQNNEAAIIAALHSDFKKTEFETILSEVYPVVSELKYIIKHLKVWTKEVKVKNPTLLFGHRSRIRYENKGVVLILSPWNYPFQLAVMPLVAAIAAGNTAVIKASELTPNTSQLIKNMVKVCCESDEVVVELGAKEKSEELLTYNFDHVFFTGSTPVGRLIAKACAERLIPVTLELGGKSPTIVDDSADIDEAADKIFWGKYLNRGQSCIAPDYVLIQESVAPAFLNRIRDLSKNNLKSEKTGFINENYYLRLKKLCNTEVNLKNEALEIVELNNSAHDLMKEEIFGPILPVLRFNQISDLPKLINTQEKPLSLYIFSKNEKHIEYLLTHFPSGNVGINSTLVQFGNHYLPFGGIGESGVGRYHGYSGFLEMSHQRSIIEQKYLSFTRKIFLPPYTKEKYRLLNWLKHF